MYTDEEYIFNMFKAGASGYVLKQSVPTELISAIHEVFKGNSYLSPLISTKVIEHYIHSRENTDGYETLTDREMEVLQLIAEGLTNREISKELNLSIKTIGTHRTNLMRKLSINNIAGLTRYAIRKGVIE